MVNMTGLPDKKKKKESNLLLSFVNKFSRKKIFEITTVTSLIIYLPWWSSEPKQVTKDKDKEEGGTSL